ncbi:MAG: DUF4268 domain-containing protein [Cyclobacteriaceae bacterium]|nr:DUF4268 domain-containing protein [Cyclobacteriaceae bacterium]
MYTREESSRLRQEFWTTFGRYMSAVPSVEGNNVNWINYHTGVNNLFFRMNVEGWEASIAITLEHRDLHLQAAYFEKLRTFKKMLHAELQEEWVWKLHDETNNRIISRVYKALPDVSVLNKETWPEIISFFKPRIVALDRFWENAKYGFEESE